MNEKDRRMTWEHSRGVCRACGFLLGESGVVHHRQAKGMGGRKGAKRAGLYFDRPPITEVLHDYCHKWIHANPERARETGHIVSNWAEVSEVPVTVVNELRYGGPDNRW